MTPGSGAADGAEGLGAYYESMKAGTSGEAATPQVSRVDWSKFEGHGRRLSGQSSIFAYVTFVMLVIYFGLAALSGFALIGIAPLLMSFRSYMAGEKLAPVAVLRAIAGMVTGFILWPL